MLEPTIKPVGNVADTDAMTLHAPSRRWTSLLLCSALVLGACGSGESSAGDDTASPSALALDESTATVVDTDSAETTDASVTDIPSAEESGFDIAEFASLADLENVELTPEVFEELKTNEASRAAILEEMEAQGLDADSAVCFLDEVSPGLFIAFGTGQEPTDEQFGELLTLLDTCEVAFGATS